MGVKLNKVGSNPNIKQKPALNTKKNDMNLINKKLDINDKKVKVILKREENEREKNILKIKNDLKKGKIKPNGEQEKSVGKRPIEHRIQGFKNIKDMIESNLKQQRISSTKNIKSKLPGKK